MQSISFFRVRHSVLRSSNKYLGSKRCYIVLGVPQEGEPPSKKAKWSPDEHQSLDPVNQIESKVVARYSYFKKLLEAPLELPKSTKDLRTFLSLRKEKLPLTQETTYWNINESDLVKLAFSKGNNTGTCI